MAERSRTAWITLACTAALGAASLLAACGASAPEIPQAACWGTFKKEDLQVLIDSGSDVSYSGSRTLRRVYPDGVGSYALCMIDARDGPRVDVLVERMRDRWAKGKWQGPGPDAKKVSEPAEVSKNKAVKYISCDRSAFRTGRVFDPNMEKTVLLSITARHSPQTDAGKAALTSMLRDLESYVRKELACA
ncbi:hypothetical protein ABZV60_01515 [Streptomyces sp. NPDC004787]|uniref:hypothetical protein n=1 Tax=Streptomyces sp. NPDC004787 TaxID=3154291 RepID=UPI00339FE8E9